MYRLRSVSCCGSQVDWTSGEERRTADSIAEGDLVAAELVDPLNSADHTVNTLRYADRLKSKANRNFDPKDAVFFKKDGAMFEEADDDDDLGRSESPQPARVPLYQMDRIDEANNRRGGRENSAPKRENSSKKLAKEI